MSPDWQRSRNANCHWLSGSKSASNGGPNCWRSPATSSGRPTLAASLSGLRREKLGKQVKQSRLQVRLLQNESLANWVLAQRLLLHVSQMIEIIATGGRLKPTYAEGDSSLHARGALVNDEA
jgi:hypothetical protein